MVRTTMGEALSGRRRGRCGGRRDVLCIEIPEVGESCTFNLCGLNGRSVLRILSQSCKSFIRNIFHAFFYCK